MAISQPYFKILIIRLQTLTGGKYSKAELRTLWTALQSYDTGVFEKVVQQFIDEKRLTLPTLPEIGRALYEQTSLFDKWVADGRPE